MPKLKTVAITQEAIFPGSPHEVYELLMDAKKHAEFTGGEALISRKVGGSFTIFDGWASGKNIELISDQKIVQLWRAEDWPAGHFSTATFQLLPTKGGTKLTFSQVNVPTLKAKDVAKGWREYYWKPMKELLTT